MSEWSAEERGSKRTDPEYDDPPPGSAPTLDGRWFEVYGNNVLIADGVQDTLTFSGADSYDSAGNSVAAPTWMQVSETGGLIFEPGAYSLAFVVEFEDAAGGYREAFINYGGWGSTTLGRWAPLGVTNLKAPLSECIVIDEDSTSIIEITVRVFQNSGDDLNAKIADGYVRKIG